MQLLSTGASGPKLYTALPPSASFATNVQLTNTGSALLACTAPPRSPATLPANTQLTNCGLAWTTARPAPSSDEMFATILQLVIVGVPDMHMMPPPLLAKLSTIKHSVIVGLAPPPM